MSAFCMAEGGFSFSPGRSPMCSPVYLMSFCFTNRDSVTVTYSTKGKHFVLGVRICERPELGLQSIISEEIVALLHQVSLDPVIDNGKRVCGGLKLFLVCGHKHIL